MKSKGKRLVQILGLVFVLGLVLSLWMVFSSRQDRVYRDLADSYAGVELDYQGEIMQELQNMGAPYKELGQLFLPEDPASHPRVAGAHQAHVPLYNQHDPRWGDKPYGTDGSRKIWENGCAIVALAMVDSYYSGRMVRPDSVAKWAGDDYYLHGQGSTWTIFEAYGQDHGYQVVDVGRDFNQLASALDQGGLGIVSVGPGYFTDVGHIMVVRGYEDYHVYLNDPNDNPAKFFSIQPIHIDILDQEAINYWAVYPA